jgi:hypothetical protein
MNITLLTLVLASLAAVPLAENSSGDWSKLTSKDFADSIIAAEGNKSKRSIVTKSGFLTDEEIQKRKLTAKVADGQEERSPFGATNY